MRVLGIETSCDETAIALYDGKQHRLLGHHIYSQLDHQAYGGVVPELASRDHIRKTLPLIQAVLEEAKLTRKDIDGIAYTKGPGLIGALMVGACIAKSLAFSLNIPSIGLHHMESHLMVIHLEKQTPNYPFVALLVSGGHTMLVHVQAFNAYAILGESVDDAVGEAFDKTAKLLGWSYPGGAVLAEHAKQGNPNRFQFPRPMQHHPNLNFSFSGLKTHAVHCFKAHSDEQSRYDIACAFQEAAVDVLMHKSLKALDQTKLNQLVVVGGVSANQLLRERLAQAMNKRSGQVYYPRLAFCTDNGAMVAYNGWLHFQHGEKENPSQIQVLPKWNLTSTRTQF